VLALEKPLEFDAARANVDPHDRCVRPAHGVARRLHRTAPRDQDRSVVAVWFARPKEMEVGSPPFVVPLTAVRVEIVDRRRIRVSVVKSVHPRRRRSSGVVSRVEFSPVPSPSLG
jgi:hypothetical protein